MVIDNVKRYETLKKFIKVVENICMGIQLIFMLLIFLCTLHIGMNVFEITALDGLNPLFDLLKDFSTWLFGDKIKHDAVVDGREVVFVLFSMLSAYILSQLRAALDSAGKNVGRMVVNEKERVETEFNAELKQNLIDDIMAQSNYMMAIQFRARWLMKDSVGIIPPTDEEINKVKMEAVGKFFQMVKAFDGLKFSKDDDILIISSNNVNNFDSTLTKIWAVVNAIKAEYKEKKYGIRVKILVDSFKPLTSVNSVYKNIAPLFNLNANNETICYGNFKNRYELIENSEYYLAVKGKYDMVDGTEDTVWSIIKKD